MIKHLRGFVIASLLGFATPESYAQDVLIFADDNYRPVTYLNAKNEPSGVLADVLQHYSAVTGENIMLKLYPWKRAYVSATKGLGGVIGLSMTEERLKLFDFSQPIYDDNINVIVLKGQEFEFKTLSDLKGKKIGVQLGASYGTEVDAAIRNGSLTVEPDQNHHSRLLKLLYGRIDAAFIGNGQAGLDNLLESDPALA